MLTEILEMCRNAKHRGEAGFTLLELLVVLVLIGLLAAFVGPKVLGYIGSSKVKAVNMQMEGFKSALELYFLDVGTYPTEEQGLKALVSNPGVPGWNGPYLREGQVPQDPWTHDYLYRNPVEGAAFRIISRGRDGRDGGAGEDQDITSR